MAPWSRAARPSRGSRCRRRCSVLAIEHAQDAVPRLEGERNADRRAWLTVTADVGADPVAPAPGAPTGPRSTSPPRDGRPGSRRSARAAVRAARASSSATPTDPDGCATTGWSGSPRAALMARSAGVNPSTALATVLVDELVRGGVREAVLCPGSRSAPLAYALQEADRGRAAAAARPGRRALRRIPRPRAGQGHPAPRRSVVTTSGTAVANLHPAVLEAHHGQVPLLVAQRRPAAGAARHRGQPDHDPARHVRRGAAVVAGARRSRAPPGPGRLVALSGLPRARRHAAACRPACRARSTSTCRCASRSCPPTRRDLARLARRARPRRSPGCDVPAARPAQASTPVDRGAAHPRGGRRPARARDWRGRRRVGPRSRLAGRRRALRSRGRRRGAPRAAAARRRAVARGPPARAGHHRRPDHPGPARGRACCAARACASRR